MREKIYPIERIIASTSYLTMGLVGFIWIIIGLFSKARLKHFLQYHIFQSIFISLLFVILSYILTWIANLLGLIPFINKLVAQVAFLLNMPLILGYSLIQTIVYSLLFYLAITSFMGRYSYIPWISDVINQNVGR